MTVEMPRPEGPRTRRQQSGLTQLITGRLQRGHPAAHMRNLSIGGRILRVAVREGNPAWPPLLLCNGIGASLELLQPLVDALDPRRPAIRFDMPGIGGSPAPVIPYHLHTLPSLLAGLLDELGHEQADVLGISWGGGLAQQFALSRPGRVRRLVLVATGTGALMVPGDPRVLLKMLTPRRHQDRGYAARIAGELYGGSARRDPAVARDLLHLTSRLGPARGYYYQLLSGIGWTSLPHLWRLRQPTLILAGDDDPIIPLVNARIMHRLIPDSTLHVYSGGHLELAVDTERIVRVVEAFLSPEEPRMAQVSVTSSASRRGRLISMVRKSRSWAGLGLPSYRGEAQSSTRAGPALLLRPCGHAKESPGRGPLAPTSPQAD